MKQHSQPNSLISIVFTQPVKRLILASFIFIALVPVSFLGMKLYYAAWENAWREIYEKHRLLALNLASPIEIFLSDHRAMLMVLASSINKVSDQDQGIFNNLRRAQHYLKDFRALVLLDLQGVTRVQTFQKGLVPIGDASNDTRFAVEPAFQHVIKRNSWYLSGVKSSPIDAKPTLILAQPVRDAQNRVIGALIGELKVDLIEKLRRNIKFGEGGHSAIVDNYGRVVAHPNMQWMKDIKDISDWGVVKRMLAGETGVTEFHSIFVKQQMVAGFASVPTYGWGVMVPQPKSEVEAQVRGLLYSQLGWGLLGLLFAIGLAIGLAHWVMTPINRLAMAAKKLEEQDYSGEMPDDFNRAPREIQQLGHVFRAVVSGLQASRDEVNKLNQSLQTRIDTATRQLKSANKQLIILARSDHLTRLANRRYFETVLTKTLHRRRSDTNEFCLLLIDVDHFKEINDTYGHSAGDTVLLQIANILRKAMRQGDLVARFGGDEFAAHMQCSLEVGRERARALRNSIDECQFNWQGHDLHLTVSIGLIYCDQEQNADLAKLLSEVDEAMYRAKKQGRNDVAEVIYQSTPIAARFHK
jgi:diguanylate cyclase (GGDEF)-like protein